MIWLYIYLHLQLFFIHTKRLLVYLKNVDDSFISISKWSMKDSTDNASPMSLRLSFNSVLFYLGIKSIYDNFIRKLSQLNLYSIASKTFRNCLILKEACVTPVMDNRVGLVCEIDDRCIEKIVDSFTGNLHFLLSRVSFIY